jgi:transposase
VAKRKGCPCPSFSDEFKADIVDRCLAGDRSVPETARDFDLTETAMRTWVPQAEVDTGKREGLTNTERDELAQLRRGNRRPRENVEILKPARAFMQSLGLSGSASLVEPDGGRGTGEVGRGSVW